MEIPEIATQISLYTVYKGQILYLCKEKKLIQNSEFDFHIDPNQGEIWWEPTILFHEVKIRSKLMWHSPVQNLALH